MRDRTPHDALTDLYATAALPPRAQASLPCARHAQEAGTIRVHRGWQTGSWVVVVESFVCKEHRRVDEREGESLQDAIGSKDLRWIYTLDTDYVPFYCAECDLAYCSSCWGRRPAIEQEADDENPLLGTCPEGHQRRFLRRAFG